MRDVLTTAVEMHQAGQWTSAALLYRKVLECEQQNADALHLLGVLQHQQGNHAQAVELIGAAIALRPNVAAWHANPGRGRFEYLGQFRRAAGCCRAAAAAVARSSRSAVQPRHGPARARPACRAVSSFRRALQSRPGFAVAHNNLGVSLRELGQLDEALSQFRQAVEVGPDSAAARTNLGLLLLDRGQPEAALPHCREAVRLQPDMAALHHNLGNVLHKLGRLVEARAAYLEALRLEPDLAVSHARLGLVLRQEGRLADALPWLNQAVGLQPDNATFWEYLGELHGEQRKGQRRGHPLLAARAGPGPAASVPAHLALGAALQEDGQLAGAGQHYRPGRPLAAQLGAGRPGSEPGLAARGTGRAGRGRERLPLCPPLAARLRPAARPPGDAAARQTARRRPR